MVMSHNNYSTSCNYKRNVLTFCHAYKNQESEDYQYRLSEETREFNETMKEIKIAINNSIINANRYESIIVHNILMRIQQIIEERSINYIDTIKYVHRETFCLLEYQFHLNSGKYIP